MSILSDITNAIIGIADSLIHNILGLAILGLIAFFIYIKFFKAKEVDESYELFRKRWGAATSRLRFKSPKKLALCPMALTVEELREQPQYQIQYQLIGNIIGINCIGGDPNIQDKPIKNIKTLENFAKDTSEQNYFKLLAENQKLIDNDKFWITLACEKVVGGIPIFRKKEQTLIFMKPKQIININSNDNVIRVRGMGLEPVGYYEIVTDELININTARMVRDDTTTIMREVVLKAYGDMGTAIKHAMATDSDFRKDAAKEGLRAASNVDKNKEVDNAN